MRTARTDPALTQAGHALVLAHLHVARQCAFRHLKKYPGEPREWLAEAMLWLCVAAARWTGGGVFEAHARVLVRQRLVERHRREYRQRRFVPPEPGTRRAARMSAATAAEVKRRLAEGQAPTRIACELNVSLFAVRDIKQGRTWQTTEERAWVRAITVGGVTKTLSEWAAAIGVPMQTLSWRVNQRGDDPAEAVRHYARERGVRVD